MIGALCYKIDYENKAKIYPVGAYNDVNWNNEEQCALGEKYSVFSLKETVIKKPYIKIEQGVDGEFTLRFVETKRYMVKIENCSDDAELPHFQNEGNRFLKLDKDKDSVSFQFINYLGRSRMTFGTGECSQSVCFEIVPDKMNYEDDYISMTEALAQICSELLLDYSGATSNRFRQSDNTSQTLLEQFIFLRQFCYSQNIQSLFESIKRNPDRMLVREEVLKPLGTGIPSRKLYSNPLSYGKGWQRVRNHQNGSSLFVPQEAAVTQKYDSLDTVANRFIKYAFQQFDFVCTRLIEILSDEKENVKQAECVYEATAIHRMLDDIFKDQFWKEIGMIDLMPQNNQVLQKREGYSQIFSAYSMLDMALQLSWKGKEAAYEGEAKNVALLYEYWLFFELYKIIASIDGCEKLEIKETPFITRTDSGVTVSLEQDKKSCQSFIIKKYGVRINLYYNRTFSPSEFTTTRYEGSYSRPFRPDYTIAVYPESYNKGAFNGEKQAVRNGAVSYIHFDAKYRITDLTAFIGRDGEGTVLDDNAEVIEDKIESVTNTYRRGDLLKMHTYNDAIRRTIGSYVLYPGTETTSQELKASYRIYDEILPGVGAFAVKPGNVLRGEEELKRFITMFIDSDSKNNSRLNRMRYYTEAVLREPTVSALDMRKNGRELDSPKNREMLSGDVERDYIIGYIRNDSNDDYYSALRDNKLLSNGEQFLFYFYAIKGNYVYSHHKDIARAKYFRFYTNKISETNKYILEPVLCKIESNELISKSELVNRLNEQGFNTDEKSHHADFYYVLTVRVMDDNYRNEELEVSKVNSQNGNDTFSPHSPKVVHYTEV